MSILRTIKCDVCGATATEGQENEGWMRWGQLQGIGLDGIINPALCKDCLIATANFVNALKHHRGVVEPMLPVLTKLNEVH